MWSMWSFNICGLCGPLLKDQQIRVISVGTSVTRCNGYVLDDQ